MMVREQTYSRSIWDKLSQMCSSLKQVDLQLAYLTDSLSKL